jgi:hypothetical protein
VPPATFSTFFQQTFSVEMFPYSLSSLDVSELHSPRGFVEKWTDRRACFPQDAPARYCRNCMRFTVRFK